jgi:hypothetical protein
MMTWHSPAREKSGGMPEDIRRCALCENLRPESGMTRSGAEWTCLNQRTCQRGQEIRAEAKLSEVPFTKWWQKDSYYRMR